MTTPLRPKVSRPHPLNPQSVSATSTRAAKPTGHFGSASQSVLVLRKQTPANSFQICRRSSNELQTTSRHMAEPKAPRNSGAVSSS